MNAIYRIVWNATAGRWVVASELAKGRKKKSTVTIAIVAALAFAGMTGAASAMDAIGEGAVQGNPNNTVIGDGAQGPAGACSGVATIGTSCSTVIGRGASATEQGAVAIGDNAMTTGSHSLALGVYSRAAQYAQAMGAGAQATGQYSSAIGFLSVASGGRSVAIGQRALADGEGTIAMGNAAQAHADYSVVMGNNSSVDVTAKGAVAIGPGAKVNADMGNGVALGNNSVVDRFNAVSVGTNSAQRQIVHVAKGTADTDAVNVSQLKPVIDGLGGGTSIDPTTGAVTGPTYNVGGNTYNNFGDALTNVDGRTTTNTANITKNAGDITNLTNAINDGTIGLVQQDPTSRNITVGKGVDGTVMDITGTVGARKIAGVAAGTADTDAVNVSQLKDVQDQVGDIDALAVKYDDASKGSITLGGSAGTQIKNVADGTENGDAVNLGQLNTTKTELGDQIDDVSKSLTNATRYFKADGKNDGTDDAVVTGKNSVAIGAGSVASRDNSVDIGGRQITHVAAGTEDTDAVNVSQLKQAGLVGGDGSTLDAVVYDAGSNRGMVTFGGGVGGTRLTNVAAGLVTATSSDAINGSQLWAVQDQVNKLGDRVVNIEHGQATPVAPIAPADPGAGASDPHFASSGDKSKPAVASGSDSVAVGAGSLADRANTVSVGSAGNERQVTNVAAGTQTTDAANWGQVQDALKTANRYADDRFSTLDRKVDQMGRRANSGAAQAMAMASIPQAYAPGLNAVGVGVGNYAGQSAIAIGASTISESGRWVFRVNGSANSSGEKGVGAGAAMVW
jgi:autotransporter adhesin